MNPHQPFKLEVDFEENLEKALNLIENGTNARDAVMIAFEITKETWYKWRKYYEEDVEDGFNNTASNLILLFEKISNADLTAKSNLEQRAYKRALTDETPDMLKFVLERRFDYIKKNKSDVEVGTKEDTTFNINIVKPEEKKD